VGWGSFLDDLFLDDLNYGSVRSYLYRLILDLICLSYRFICRGIGAMSNDAVLINIQTNDLSFMEDGGRPEEYTEVATGAYRFPVPWFFCFDTEVLA